MKGGEDQEEEGGQGEPADPPINAGLKVEHLPDVGYEIPDAVDVGDDHDLTEDGDQETPRGAVDDQPLHYQDAAPRADGYPHDHVEQEQQGDEYLPVLLNPWEFVRQGCYDGLRASEL